MKLKLGVDDRLGINMISSEHSRLVHKLFTTTNTSPTVTNCLFTLYIIYTSHCREISEGQLGDGSL